MKGAESPARKRARALFIQSKGQASYEEIRLKLRLEGLGETAVNTLRQWRKRDIEAGSVNLEDLAAEFEKMGRQAERTAQALSLPDNLTLEQKIDAARLADLEDSHERMLRVVNAAAARLEEELPRIPCTEIGHLTTLSTIAERIAESSIKLRLALVQVQELRKKLIGAQDEDGKAVHAEIFAPEKPAGLTGAVAKFRAGG